MIIKRTLTRIGAVGAATALAMALTAAPAQAETTTPSMHPRYCAPGHVLVYVDLLGIRVCVRSR